MKLFSLLVFVGFSLTNGLDIFDIAARIPDPAIIKVITMKGPSNGAVTDYICDLPHLNAIQIAFNQRLGIDTSLTWKNASTLYYATSGVVAQGVSSYMEVCTARKDFYLGMGATYTDCTNPLFLAGNLPAGGNLTQAYAYGAMWTQLDFICNGGLGIGLYSYTSLMAVYSTPAGELCTNSFLASINSNPADMCNIVSQYMLCLQDAYLSTSHDPQGGWWICERSRVGYAPYCPNLRCYVTNA